jgi:hypothetical protein
MIMLLLLQITFSSMPTPGYGSWDVAVDHIQFMDCTPGAQLPNPGKQALVYQPHAEQEDTFILSISLMLGKVYTIGHDQKDRVGSSSKLG